MENDEMKYLSDGMDLIMEKTRLFDLWIDSLMQLYRSSECLCDHVIKERNPDMFSKEFMLVTKALNDCREVFDKTSSPLRKIGEDLCALTEGMDG